MTDAEFQQFREQAVREYAQARVEAGGWAPEEAERLSEQSTRELLPNGLDTEGMSLLVGEDEHGTPVGRVWVALQDRERPGAWIYDIEVLPGERGKGRGRELLHATEQLVREQGVETIGLNVFAGNAVARHLYASTGYEPTSIQMRKPLR
jgi:GNAT superfamily N-acetyltransferase